MTGFDLGHGGAHAFRKKTLQLGLDRTISCAHSSVSVLGKGGNVDRPGDADIIARRSDDPSTVGVADENCGAFYSLEHAFCGGNVGLRSLKAILRSKRFVSSCLKQRDNPAKARAVERETVAENDSWSRRIARPLFGWHRQRTGLA